MSAWIRATCAASVAALTMGLVPAAAALSSTVTAAEQASGGAAPTTARRAHKPPRKHRVDVRKFRNFDAAQAAHVPLVVPHGAVVSLSKPIRVDSNLDLLVNGVLRKAYSSGGGATGAFIRNRDFRHKVKKVHIWGSGTIGATRGRTGGMIALYGDHTRLTGFHIDRWSGSRALVLDGNHISTAFLDISGSPAGINNGGIRITGGKGYRDYHSRVVSGDDALQFVPVGSAKAPLYDHSIRDGRFVGTYGFSHSAKAMVAGLQGRTRRNKPILRPVMKASITNVGWYGVTGTAGKWAAALQNLSSSGVIAGVHYGRDVIDQSRARGRHLRAEVQFNATPGCGGIHDVSGTITVRQPRTKLYDDNGPVRGVQVHVRSQHRHHRH